MTRLAALPSRAVLEIEGEDRIAFLQGLVSNDVTEAAPGRAVWAALPSPQGKWLADFFIFADGERLLLDCEAGQAGGLEQRLSRYRLRAKVTITPAGLPVHASWAGLPPTEGIFAPDPGLDEGAGWRILGSISGVNATAEDYDLHRLQLGLPGGSRDLEPEKSTLLEAGFDELHGVSWSKGCYMGQELTARAKYRGLVKRRLTRVRIEGSPPAPGTPIRDGETEVGTMRSSRAEWGLGLLRLEAIRAERLRFTDAVLVP